jgi:hypothetical protein
MKTVLRFVVDVLAAGISSSVTFSAYGSYPLACLAVGLVLAYGMWCFCDGISV